jgi:two-component system chemotaxis sensor kinase CheA
VLAQPDADVRDAMLSLLPVELERNGRVLKAEYKVLENDKFMLVLTDMTEERRMAILLAQERQRLEIIVMAVSDSRNFFEAIDGLREFLGQGFARLLAATVHPHAIATALYREIHTYKGLLNQFSFVHTPKALHAAETRLSDLLAQGVVLTHQQLMQSVSSAVLQTALDADLAVLSEALGHEFLARGESVVLSHTQVRQLQALVTRLLRGLTVDTSVAEVRTLLDEIINLRKVSFQDVLLGFDGVVRQAAQRLEKEVLPIEVSGGLDVWIDPFVFQPFLRSLVHVFRNAVTHGLETPECRWEAEKDEAGKITCSVTQKGNTIDLTIADDGAGIALDALRQRAVATGLYGEQEVLALTDEEITQLIFADNISTHQGVTELAGRGVGLAAVMNETKSIGGAVAVTSVRGQGTWFRFTLPLLQESKCDEMSP